MYTFAAQDPEQDGKNSNHEEDLKKATQGVGSDEPQVPEDDENDRDGVEHCLCPFLFGQTFEVWTLRSAGFRRMPCGSSVPNGTPARLKPDKVY